MSYRCEINSYIRSICCSDSINKCKSVSVIRNKVNRSHAVNNPVFTYVKQLRGLIDEIFKLLDFMVCFGMPKSSRAAYLNDNRRIRASVRLFFFFLLIVTLSFSVVHSLSKQSIDRTLRRKVISVITIAVYIMREREGCFLFVWPSAWPCTKVHSRHFAIIAAQSTSYVVS